MGWLNQCVKRTNFRGHPSCAGGKGAASEFTELCVTALDEPARASERERSRATGTGTFTREQP